jgi:hypothetical protein
MIKLKQILIETISNTEFGHDIHFLVENKDRLIGDSRQILIHLIKLELIRDQNLQNYWTGEIETFIDNIIGNPSFNPKYSNIRNLLKSPQDKPFQTWYNQARNKYNQNKQINQISFPLFSMITDEQKNKIISAFNSIVENITKEGYLDYSSKVGVFIKNTFPIKND